MPDSSTIIRMAAAVDVAQQGADEAKAELKATFLDAEVQGLHIGAFKSALKLRKLSPVEQRAWLDCFDACREALGLGAQTDVEDILPAEAKGKRGPKGFREGNVHLSFVNPKKPN